MMVGSKQGAFFEGTPVHVDTVWKKAECLIILRWRLGECPYIEIWAASTLDDRLWKVPLFTAVTLERCGICLFS